MNKHNTQSILKFSLLIAIAITSGCGQSTVTDSPTSTSIPVIPTVTATPLPCYSWMQAPTTELEKIAERWFLSNVSQIPERSLYELVDAAESWGTICYHYQHLILTHDPIIQNPIKISLEILTQPPGKDYFGIDKIVLAAANSDELLTNNNLAVPGPRDRNIMTVIVNYPYLKVQFESRIDYIYENDIWRFRWWGHRWKCINDKETEWKNTGNIYDC
jgi:hypothetical protein